MLELAGQKNLQSGVVVNCSYVTPKVEQVAVILINTNNRNIWICQLLLAAKIYEVELHPWQYYLMLYREGTTIQVGFQPVTPTEVEGNLQANQVEVKVKEEPLEEGSTPPSPSFGPHPDPSKDYNSDDEVARLPFKFNTGDAPFNKEQQYHLKNLVYNHQKVFSLHDEDLEFCEKLAHSIPTLTDKHVNLPHTKIPQQLQGVVRNAFIHGSDKASSDCQRALMPHNLSL